MAEEVKRKKKRNKPRHPEMQHFRQMEEEARLLEEGLQREPPGPGGYAALAAARAVCQEASRVPCHRPQDRENWLIRWEAGWRYERAFKNAFPLSFANSVRCLQARDASGLEDVVAYLEADPIYEDAGFTKEGLIRLLHGVAIPEKYILRLQAAVLTVVDHRHWRDFRDFCRLAKLTDGPALREQLTQRLNSSDVDTQRRARWVLDALAQKDSMEQGKKKGKKKGARSTLRSAME